ncbi:MAG TPA: hypothetical protein VN673_05670 [Clostridia bacterium]|nr:hypothetical protein [Clostridia bacterium]
MSNNEPDRTVAKWTSLLWAILTVLVGTVWLFGCTNGDTIGPARPVSVVSDPIRTKVLAAVLRDLKPPPERKVIYWLDLSDSEFVSLQKELKAVPPPFAYEQLKPTNDIANREIISIRKFSAAAEEASVRLTFSSKGSFADFLFKLKRQGEDWKVIDRQFFCAS